MKDFCRFNWRLITYYLNGTLRSQTLDKVTIYKFPLGIIDICDNGGEVNIYFEHLPGFSAPLLPKGIRITQYAFSFSIPYTDTSGKVPDQELACRLGFFLKKISLGEEVDILDYFTQLEKE